MRGAFRNMNRRTIGVAVTLAATAIVAVACDSAGPTDVSRLASGAVEAREINVKAIRCPSTTTESTVAELGPLGGVVSVGGTTVTVPAGALLTPVTMTLTVPESKYLEIDVSVAGAEHFAFELPVVVAISYARCDHPSLGVGPLSVWYFEGDPKTLLEQMPSVDNMLTRTVTFTTGHLSGYIVAN
jgi:hypothetical protein